MPTIELTAAAVEYAILRQVPVLIDVRDLWPDIFVDALSCKVRPIGSIMVAPFARALSEALQAATGITAISKGYLDWAMVRARRPARWTDQVFPLGYRSPLGYAVARPPSTQGKLTCWFLGTFGRTYDLETVIEAARRLLTWPGGQHIRFVFSGGGEKGPVLQHLAKAVTNVSFTGWLDASQIANMMRTVDVGLASYVPNAPQSVPNKIAEYLAAGLPIINSLVGETAALIENHQCGLTYHAGDPCDLAQKLLAIVSQPMLRDDMGRRARALFESQFAAEVVYAHMADHIEAVIAERPVCAAAHCPGHDG
jgi:glycosyltransferase involved in cell wall biosynthesis